MKTVNDILNQMCLDEIKLILEKEKMERKQERLLKYASDLHSNQVRKYTGEPYIEHCIKVGKKAEDYQIELGWEIGICHDLIEDTECSYIMLLKALYDCGYNNFDSYIISSSVIELTDVYTHEDYPNLNRKERKDLEAKRLWGISPEAQSVKYCDLIDNTESICNNDPKFAKVYLEEKKYILKGMRSGNAELLATCELAIKLNGG